MPSKWFAMIALLTAILVIHSVHSLPMPQKMVDMTYTFDDRLISYPGMTPFQLRTVRNGTVRGDNLWIQIDEYSAADHVGTHIDAPSHFVPGGLTVDQLPLENLIAPAAVIDITEQAKLNRDYEVTAEDLLRWEDMTGETLNGKFVLLKSGWGQKWHNATDYLGTNTNDPRYIHSPGFGADAAWWMVKNRWIKGVGSETLTFDTGTTQIKPVHSILLRNGVIGIEIMANMDQIPCCGAILHVMPMKLGYASGAPTRVVAVFSDVMFQKCAYYSRPAFDYYG